MKLNAMNNIVRRRPAPDGRIFTPLPESRRVLPERGSVTRSALPAKPRLETVFTSPCQRGAAAHRAALRGQGQAAPAPAARAFTLIELLVVISIIGLLAAFTLGVTGAVNRTKNIHAAQAEMALIETGLERYKDKYGFYPPSSSNTTNLLINPLYFELQGVTNVIVPGPATNVTTLDGMNFVPLASVNSAFGVAGFVNCSHGTGEDAVPAINFLPGLKTTQWHLYNNVPLLAVSVGGPDAGYQPLGVSGLNPWRYNSISPTNNPGRYDLYVQLVIGGKTNLICNWSTSVAINNPLQ